VRPHGDRALRADLAASMERFSWDRVIGDFDAELDRLVTRGRPTEVRGSRPDP
jgi:hypothetical protein